MSVKPEAARSRSARGRVRIARASAVDRNAIYRLRHEVFAREIRQHPENAEERLTDPLDAFNEYIIASIGGELAGCISITPPGHGRYSVDRYVERAELPFPCDDHLYEVRLLAVAKPFRGWPLAPLLMYAALRWVEAHGGSRIVVVGRCDLLDMYRKTGLEPIGRQVECGAVRFEVMSATTARIREHVAPYARLLRKAEAAVDWQLEMPMVPHAGCCHGGAL
jgi:GNAT superfamily N-acetyltransferase